MKTLTLLLRNEGYTVFTSSEKKNKILRFMDMCSSIFLYRKKVDILLIDTFSTLNFYYAVAVSQLARIFHLKYIPILHGGNLPERIKRSPYVSNLIFKNAMVNCAPSSFLYQFFLEKGYNTICIPNAVALQKIPFKNRNEFCLKLLWVRAFHKTYNPLMAVKVIAQLKLRFDDVQLCMVGPDKDGSLALAKQLSTKLGLNENITFTGVLSREEWMRKSTEYDIFINTTNVDNTPVSIIEAMALGLAIVSTNVGGIPFLLENTKEALLVEKNNVEMMSEAVIHLITHQNETKEMTLNAQKKAESFDAVEVIKQWKNLLK